MPQERDLAPFSTTDLTGTSVLALAAHPDDEILGCGGALALHARKGDAVSVVVITGGEEGNFNKRYGDDYRDIREREDLASLAALGLSEAAFWRLPDRALAQEAGLVARIEAVLRETRPGLVYVPAPTELHPDHRVLAHAAWEAVCNTGLSCRLAFYEVSAPLRPNVLVDITTTAAAKEEAIRCHVSQLAENDYLTKIMGLNRYRSYTLPEGVHYAEAFWLVEPLSVHPAPLDHYMTEYGRIPREAGTGPLVSIIVRTKDRPRLLTEALASIHAQTYGNLEVVVVNDGGMDVSDAVKQFQSFLKLQYHAHATTLGRSAAANTGLRNASGQYMGFLDDDDLLYPDHVGTLVKFLTENNQYQVAYTDSVCGFYELDTASGRYQSRHKQAIFHQDFDRELLLFDNHIPNACVLFSRCVIDMDRLEFDEGMHAYEDWDFWIRMSRRYDFHRVPRVTMEYRVFDAADLESDHRRKYDMERGFVEIYRKNLPLITVEALMRYRQKRQAETRDQRDQQEELRQKADRLQAQLQELRGSIADRDGRIHHLAQERYELSDTLHHIYGSRSWRILARLDLIKNRILAWLGLSRAV